jgi:predicted GNAT superfamily acetyltransferase
MALAAAEGLAALEIRDAREEEFVACERLMRAVYGFSEAEALPAWQMFAATLAGGVTLTATINGTLVGSAHAFPGGTAMPATLYAVSLVVAPDARNHGTGRRLMEVLRDRARAHGYCRVRWSTDSFAVPLLHLYLNRLGARLTQCHAAMYDVVRPGTAQPGVPGDEFDVDWQTGPREPQEADEPQFDEVALPLAAESLARADPAAARRWRYRVRDESQKLFTQGFVAVGLRTDRTSGLAHLRFMPRGNLVGT